MEERLNLIELLQGHEGEQFYNPLLGYATLREIGQYALTFYKDGGYFMTTGYGEDMDGNISVFPSRECRDWKVYKDCHQRSVTVKVVTDGPDDHSVLLDKRVFVPADANIVSAVGKIADIIDDLNPGK